MNVIDYGQYGTGRGGDSQLIAFMKLEENILELAEKNAELEARIKWLESKFRVHVRGG